MQRIRIITLSFSLLALGAPAVWATADGPDSEQPPRKERRDAKDRPDRANRERLRPGPPRMTEADQEAALQIIEQINPQVIERLRDLRESDPASFAREIRRGYPMAERMIRLKRFDPEMFELRVQDIKLVRRSRLLARQVIAARDAEDSDKAEALRGQLNEVIEQRFAVRSRIREAELERLEQRLAELREQLKQRDEQKQALIENHVEELLEGAAPETDASDDTPESPAPPSDHDQAGDHDHE